jgi:hypothetical protein
MKLSIREDTIDLATFERLFTEAWPYISAERQRAGEDELKAALWNSSQKERTLIYEQDGYIVGVISFTLQKYNGKQYFQYLWPTFGADSNGSRAWFYSKEYKESSEKLKEIFPEVEGVMIIGNPESPAMKGVQKKFNEGNSAYSSMELETITEVFNSGLAGMYPDTFRVFLMEF